MTRLVRAYKDNGAEAFVSKRRGAPGNRAFDPAFKEIALAIVREKYADFVPALVVEKLEYRHRYRRDCFGELIQIDGSEHDWFDGRAPRCCPLVFIDDATSRIVELRFCPAESTFDYIQSTKRYLVRHGKPVAFYGDKHSVFRVNRKEAAGGTGLTRFGRALHDLNVDIIYAQSSQAEGRVERMNQTLQGLVNELRFEGIDTIEAANEFLPGYMDVIHAKFAKEPLSVVDLHRPLTELDDLEESMCWRKAEPSRTA